MHGQLPHPVHRRHHRPDHAAHAGRRGRRRAGTGPHGDDRCRHGPPSRPGTHGRRAAGTGRQPVAEPVPGRTPTATADTLADLSLSFWMRDLRTGVGFENDVPAIDGRAGADLDWKADPAFWQHVNFSALSYGADGLLDASRNRAVQKAIATGTQEWFTAPNFPTPPNNALFPVTNPRAVTVDDLWHAAVNGRGKFVFAETPIEVAYGLGSIISGIAQRPQGAGRGNVREPQPVHVRRDESHPLSDLEQLHLRGDDRTRLVGRTEESDDRHDERRRKVLYAGPPARRSPRCWPRLRRARRRWNDFDNTWFLNRNIVTRDVDAGTFAVVPFRWADLNYGTQHAAQHARGHRDAAEGVVAYLRGGSTFGAGPTPTVIESTAIGQFRGARAHRRSSATSATQAGRRRPREQAVHRRERLRLHDVQDRQPRAHLRVYVGANDGMFHVFNGDRRFRRRTPAAPRSGRTFRAACSRRRSTRAARPARASRH